MSQVQFNGTDNHKKLAVDGFKESILVSLDNTYKQKEGAAQFETDFTTNKNIVMGLVGKANSVNEYVNHLDQFKADTYVTRDEASKSSETVTINVSDPNKPGKFKEKTTTIAEYVKNRPEATFFEKDASGNLTPVVLNTFEDFFSYANEAAGLSPEKISAFKKREKGKKYFIENGEVKFDTPATIAEKRRKGIALPNYIEGNIISNASQQPNTIQTPISTVSSSASNNNVFRPMTSTEQKTAKRTPISRN